MKDKTGERLYSLGRIITLFIFGLCWISLPAHAADISCSHLYTGVRADGGTDRIYVGNRKPIPGPEIVAQLHDLQRKKLAHLGDFMGRELNLAPEIPGVVDRAGARKNWPSSRMPIPYVTCESANLNGPIVKGDYDRVVKLLRTNHPFLHEFFLSSPGGDVAEAVRIGRLFRQYLISTRVGTSTDALDCLSACALIWFGGVARLAKWDCIARGSTILDLGSFRQLRRQLCIVRLWGRLRLISTTWKYQSRLSS